MATHRYKVVGSMALVVAAACAVVAPNVALAAEPAQAAAVSTQDKQERPLPLLEAATADGTGSFYTLDPEEFEKATAPASQGGNGFKPKSDSTAAGITMFKEEVPGSVPVYRLRLKNGHQSYLLSKNPDAEQGSGRFENEGPIGYLYEKERPGTVALERFSKNEDWRVGRASGSILGRVDLTLQGYGQDGVLGYFVPQK